jgi:hypothetical protein
MVLQLTHALTSIRHVNKTDVVTLGSSFGSLSQVMNASMEELARCPGIGEQKVLPFRSQFSVVIIHWKYFFVTYMLVIPLERNYGSTLLVVLFILLRRYPSFNVGVLCHVLFN